MIARLRRSDSGMTLIELMVALGLLSLLLSLISVLGVRIFRVTNQVITTTRSETALQIAMSRITRQLRYAAGPDGNTAAFDTVDGSQVIFYTYSLLSSAGAIAPNKVRIWVDGSGTMWESTTTPTISNGLTVYTSTPLVAHLVDNIVNTTANPVFTWYESTDLSATSVTVGSGLALADLKALKRVQVVLQSTKSSVVSVSQTAVFQNLL